MKRYKLIILTFAILLIGGISLKIYAANNVVGSMAKLDATATDVYNSALKTDNSNAIFNLIDTKLFAKDYSYEKNSEVKEKADEQIQSIKTSDANALSEYGADSWLDLLKKTGSLVTIQRQVYAEDIYEKTVVTEKMLKDLYNKKAGELTSYYVISLNSYTFNGDQSKLETAIADVKKQLASATDKNVEQVFTDLIAKYPPVNGESGKQTSVSRDSVDAETLKKLDSFKYMEFNKEPIENNGSYEWLLKMDKGERATFEQSKDRLKEYAYTQATNNNQYLVDYYAALYRQKAKITFSDPVNKTRYDAAMSKVFSDYAKAQKEASE
ncbi:MAG: hypothetical protein LBR40_01970 [Bacilli bacterium]|jgi:hypothetical protein|nr:hypothetical protein [Bacilli bacterium]